MTLLYRIRSLVRWLFRRDEIKRALDADLPDHSERSAARREVCCSASSRTIPYRCSRQP